MTSPIDKFCCITDGTGTGLWKIGCFYDRVGILAFVNSDDLLCTCRASMTLIRDHFCDFHCFTLWSFWSYSDQLPTTWVFIVLHLTCHRTDCQSFVTYYHSMVSIMEKYGTFLLYYPESTCFFTADIACLNKGLAALFYIWFFFNSKQNLISNWSILFWSYWWRLKFNTSNECKIKSCKCSINKIKL